MPGDRGPIAGALWSYRGRRTRRRTAADSNAGLEQVCPDWNSHAVNLLAQTKS